MFGWFSNLWTQNRTKVYGITAPQVATTSGEVVTHKTASSVSSYYSAIRNVSEDMGKLPCPVYRVDADGNKEIARDHSVHRLLNKQPNPMMTAFTFKELLNSWAQGWGNGFAEIVFDNRMNATALWPIHPARVNPWVDDEQNLFYYVYPDFDIRHGEIFRSGEPIVIPDWKMLHLKGPTQFGVWGNSVLEIMAESLGISLAAQRYGASFFGNGAHHTGVLQHPASLSPEASERLVDSFNRFKGGSKGQNGTMVLEEGMKFQSVSVNPRDAQVIELRKFEVGEIARWFRIQPHKLQDLSNATYSNIESQNLDYVTDTLLTWARRWELEVENKLLLSDDLEIEFDFNFLLKGDRAARAQFYNTLHFIGALNVNQIRKFEGWNSIGPKGDEYYQQSAMVPLGQTEAETEAEAFEPVAASVAMKITAKEEKACANQLKKQTIKEGWFEAFWDEQAEYAKVSFLPLFTSMINTKACDLAVIQNFSEAIDHHYTIRGQNPSTTEEIMEIYRASL